MRCVGLILAGGQAVRLGGADKARLMVGGQSLLAHCVARLAPQVDRVIIAAGPETRPDDQARIAGPGRFGGMVAVADGAFAGAGPLAGILAGLRWAAQAGASSVLSLPVDTIFVPRDLAARLEPAPAVVCHGGRVHHLVALWPCAVAERLAGFLAEPATHRVGDFAAMMGMRQVAFEDPGDPFMNINRPEDLAAAERLAEGG